VCACERERENERDGVGRGRECSIGMPKEREEGGAPGEERCAGRGEVCWERRGAELGERGD